MTLTDDNRRGGATAADAALRVRAAPNPPGLLANTLTFAWRALLKIKHQPEQLFDVVVTPIMFTVMFTYLFGGALAGSPETYLQFLLPGILVQSVAFTSIYTGFTLNTDIGKGIFDRFKSMPIWAPSPVLGALVGDLARYTISALIVLVIGLIMGYRPETGLVGIVASILLLNVFAIGLSWIVVAVALVVRSPSTVMTLSWLVLMPLTFGSNIYVEPDTMPGWLQAFVAVNPVALVVTAIRDLLGGTPAFASSLVAVVGPAAVTTIFAPLAMVLYGRER